MRRRPPRSLGGNQVILPILGFTSSARRLTGVAYPSLATNSFSYNSLDTRVGKVASGGTKAFLRDGATVTDPVLSDSAATYTPGISVSRSGVLSYYGND